jgi:hypothetical protein
MPKGMFLEWPSIFTNLTIWAISAIPSFVKEAVQEWGLVNPEGVAKIEPMSVNPHPKTLVGKTVVLRANGKHNSDNFLDRIAEFLEKEVKDVEIIKTWKVVPETNTSSQNPEESKKFAQKIASLKPDLIIASQAD